MSSLHGSKASGFGGQANELGLKKDRWTFGLDTHR